MQLEMFLENAASRYPDKIALVCGDRRLTYAQLDRECNRLAHALWSQGVCRGDRVAVYLHNSVEAVVSIFAILKAGGVFLMVNPTTKPEKLTYVLDNSGARALIAEQQKLVPMQDYWCRLPRLAHVLTVGPAGRAGETCPKPVAPWEALVAQYADATGPPRKASISVDVAALIYTSGSTGNPKGVMMTHLNMVTACDSITTYLENVPEDVILDVLPLSFDYGLYQVPMAFKVGATLMLERSFTYPADVLRKLAAARVTGFPIVPTILAILLQMDLTKYDFSSLRYISNTGAALPTEHILGLRRRLRNVQIYSMYGLTECKRVSYLPPDQIDIRPKSVGKAIPNTEAYIVDAQGNRVGPGVVGELVVRGAHVMRGYWQLPEDTAHVLRPGPLPGELVLYTGDLFTMDEEGYLYFVGRNDDMIKSRGEKVSPKEVENVLHSLDGVAEAAVVGVDDPVLGQRVKAVLVLKPGAQLTEKQVQAHCAQHLEDLMVPKTIEFRETLPKNPSGKVDKLQLKAAVAG